jgi:hypothetical protein
MKDLATEFPFLSLEVLSSFWWYDWVSVPNKEDVNYNACISKQLPSAQPARDSTLTWWPRRTQQQALDSS